MTVVGLSPIAEEATRRALKYWLEHWDWECPTLFGIEREELGAVLAAWPGVAAGTEERVSQATIGAFRELLYGASSVARNDVEAVIGVPYEEACSLLEHFMAVGRPVDQRSPNDA